MPYVNIRITREGATTEQKSDLIKGATQLLADVLGKNPATTVVVIDEVDTDNWGIGGESITVRRKAGGNLIQGAATMRHELRRKERALNEPEARELLGRGEYGILSTRDPDGRPYGIPLSYCFINDAVYFHCAVEGRKLEDIAADSRVSFCVVGKTEVLPDQFATRYESVIISGRATEVFDEEKQLALEGLLVKYCAGYRLPGLDYIADKLGLTKVFKVGIEELCGKARR
jgi:4-oxalocrotonate tautomerase family enzyme